MDYAKGKERDVISHKHKGTYSKIQNNNNNNTLCSAPPLTRNIYSKSMAHKA